MRERSMGLQILVGTFATFGDFGYNNQASFVINRVNNPIATNTNSKEGRSKLLNAGWSRVVSKLLNRGSDLIKIMSRNSI